MTLKLMITEPGLQRMRSVDISQAKAIVGRATSCDVVIEGDDEVSRKQFEITYDVSQTNAKKRISNKEEMKALFNSCSWFIKDVSRHGACIKRKGAPMNGLSPKVPERLEVDDEITFGNIKKPCILKVLSC